MKCGSLFKPARKVLPILLIMAVALYFPGAIATAAGTADVSVSAPGDTVDQEEQFQVNITVVPNNDIAGMQFNLSFDPTLINIDSVAEGDLLSQDGASTYFSPGVIDNNAGTITAVYGAITSPGQTVSASGTFATITATAGAQGGACHLNLSNVVVGDINGNPVPVNVVSGTVNINYAPVLDSIGNKAVDEGDTLAFTVSATDIDEDTLTYSASSLPTGASFDTGTQIFSWTPGYDQSGVYSGVRFEISDGVLTDSEDITITVSHTNRPPVLDSIVNQTVNEGDLISFTVSATDPDGDGMTYSSSNLPSGASFNTGTQTFTWTPGYDQSGVYASIHFEVSDGDLTDSEDITITVNHTNRSPVLSSIANKTVNEGDILTFTISATDSDDDSLTYSASNLPSGASFDPVTQTFSWTPGYDKSGVYTLVHFEVSDGSLTDSENIAITVNNTNRSPVLGSIGSKTVNEGDLLTFTITGTDPDGESLTYSASNLPAGASFDPLTQTFSWTPDYRQAGTHTAIHLEVSDGSLTDSEEITINVGNIYQWDANGDGDINILDMIIIGQQFGETGSNGWIAEDINEDGTVNVLDIILIGQNWTG